MCDSAYVPLKVPSLRVSVGHLERLAAVALLRDMLFHALPHGSLQARTASLFPRVSYQVADTSGYPLWGLINLGFDCMQSPDLHSFTCRA
jgi:hypothetical protein